MSHVIECQKISKRFGGNQVLKDLDLTVDAGESVAILGPNGTGKSTLIRILASVMRQSEGKVLINGSEMKDEAFALRSQIGLLSHTGYLYTSLSAEENLKYYAEMYSLKDPEKRIAELLEKVGLRTRRFDRVATFSRGMSQRLGLARALLHSPKILLLDEPETGLDQEGLDLLWSIIKTDDPDRTVVFTSHNFKSTVQACSRLIILKKGKIVYDAPKGDLTEDGLQALYHDVTGGKS